MNNTFELGTISPDDQAHLEDRSANYTRGEAKDTDHGDDNLIVHLSPERMNSRSTPTSMNEKKLVSMDIPSEVAFPLWHELLTEADERLLGQKSSDIKKRKIPQENFKDWLSTVSEGIFKQYVTDGTTDKPSKLTKYVTSWEAARMLDVQKLTKTYGLPVQAAVPLAVLIAYELAMAARGKELGKEHFLRIEQTLWRLKAERIHPKILFDSITKQWETLGVVSALIFALCFDALNNIDNFDDAEFSFTVKAWGISLLTTATMCSMFSTMLTVLLLAKVHVLAPRDVSKFVQVFGGLVSLPDNFLLISIVALSAAICLRIWFQFQVKERRHLLAQLSIVCVGARPPAASLCHHAGGLHHV
eukprot:g12818.t1